MHTRNHGGIDTNLATDLDANFAWTPLLASQSRADEISAGRIHDFAELEQVDKGIVSVAFGDDVQQRMHSFVLPALSFLLDIAASATAHPTISPWKLHEKRPHIPVGWTRAQKLDPSVSIPLRFALTQSNIQDIETLLYDVSYSDSPNYGKHWSPDQIAAKFAPSAESIETVHAWLIDSGVEPHRVKLSPTKGWLGVTSTVQEAENLLNAVYHVYDHETGTKHIG
ncbi:hypothetical protein M405DRAFT_935689 [Rhizopogon salebrosus TDB-379]|nr:hypothetical protein M405DRAFT_935689 [Rhizopogon salebrosus TDB-379]